MKDNFLHILRTRPIFLFLLPLFFVFHGYTENYDFIPVKDALFLTSIYLGFAIGIALLSWLLFRDFTKANLFSFLVMGFNFFFGTIHDTLKKIFPGTFIVKYIFILPAVLIFFILVIIFLKRTKSGLSRIRFYLNILLIVLILADVFILTGKVFSKKNGRDLLASPFQACDSCASPDIYFILADEYAGNEELRNIFGFDNQVFLNELSRLGFRVLPYSQSNYNYTPFSVGSTLNMDYLDLKGKDRTKPDLTYSYETIRDNRLLKFFRHHGYEFYNYSVFDFEGQPARVRETFLPVKTRLITAQTFLHRFDKEIRFNLVSRWKSRRNLEILTYANKNNNENIYDLTWKKAAEKTSRPKFVYTHLMMPHYPYYFDRNGVEQPFEKLQEGFQTNRPAYIEYLQYSNKKLLGLVKHIITISEKPPLVVLMGDHGFRHFEKPVEYKYYFQNLAAVYYPDKNYAQLPDSITSVNLFRSVLNAKFGQQLTFLKDSSIYLKD